MTERELGRSSLKVSVVGLGCLGMSDFYDPKHLNDEESVRVIQRYIDAGGNFLDTADAYGVGRSEILVGKAIRGRRDEVVVATKFGHVRGTGVSSSASAAIRSTSGNAATPQEAASTE